MAWIESHQTLREHPKLYALMDTLGISKSQAIGHLHLLWWWCIDYALTGELVNSDAQIARAAEFQGDSTVFLNALIKSGFVDNTEDKISIHDWLDFCGTLIDKRLQRSNDTKKAASKKIRLASEKRRLASHRTNQPYRTVPTNQEKEAFPPTLEMVKAYCKERGNNVNTNKWLNHYQSNGWKVGKNPMKDWRAAIRKWEDGTFTPKEDLSPADPNCSDCRGSGNILAPGTGSITICYCRKKKK